MMRVELPRVGVGGRYRVTFWDVETGEREPVLLGDGSEFWGGDWHSNLITDVGLDEFAVASWYGPNTLSSGNESFRNRLTLSGDLPEVKEPSGEVQASQSGTTVTATSAFFTADDVGRAIVWADGSNARITDFVSSTSVVVDKDQVVAQQVFERWHVELQTLPGVVADSNDTPPDPADRSIYRDGDYAVHEYRRSIICEVDAAVNVNGFGIGPSNGPNVVIVENIRDANGNPITVSLLAGKAVRVDSVLEVRVSLLPWVMNYQIDEYDAGNQLINTRTIEADVWLNVAQNSGGSSQFSNALGRALQLASPAPDDVTLLGARGAFVLNGPPLVPGEPSGSITSYASNSSGTTVLSAYVVGSRRRVREFIIDAGSQNQEGTAIAFATSSGTTFGLGSNAAQLMIQFRNGETFTKENTHTLRVGIESTWDRDYTIG